MSGELRKTGAQPKNVEQEYEKALKVFRKTAPAKVTKEERNKLILVANKILNVGDIEKARTIYAALNYYAGLVQVAQTYHQDGKIIEAFAVYNQAGAKKEADVLGEKIAEQVRFLLDE